MADSTYPLRILQVFGTLDRGGADTSIMTYYKNMDRKKIQFDFAVHGERRGVLEDEILSLGGRIHRLPRLTFFNCRRYVSAWRRLLANNPQYDIVHGHYFTISGLYLAVAKMFGRKIIAHSHNTIPGMDGVLVVLFNAWLRRGSDLRLACSMDAALYLFGKRAEQAGDVVILKNPIEVGSFAFDAKVRSEVRERLGLRDRFVVGHVGRFNAQKNHKWLVLVFREVLAHSPHSVLLLVGDGSDRPEIERRVAELGLSSSVIFMGATPDVSSLMQAMDVFVLPSLYEGFGVVAIEAQAAGLPTVVSDVVPPEAMPTDLVEVVPLSSSAADWAAVILRHENSGTRASRGPDIKHAGFDGPENAKILADLYFSLIAQQ